MMHTYLHYKIELEGIQILLVLGAHLQTRGHEHDSAVFIKTVDQVSNESQPFSSCQRTRSGVTWIGSAAVELVVLSGICNSKEAHRFCSILEGLRLEQTINHYRRRWPD